LDFAFPEGLNCKLGGEIKPAAWNLHPGWNKPQVSWRQRGEYDRS
jgi:hypothetical protein